jgi:hypothetical protein
LLRIGSPGGLILRRPALLLDFERSAISDPKSNKAQNVCSNSPR